MAGQVQAESPLQHAKREGEDLTKRLEQNTPDAKLQLDVHNTMQEMKSQPAAVRDAFYKALTPGLSNAHQLLPNVMLDSGKIEEVGKGGKKEVVYDRAATQAQMQRDVHIGKGEGPFSALMRQGLAPEEAVKMAGAIKAASGRGNFGFKESEQYKLNDDKSVDVRRDDPKNPNNYTVDHYAPTDSNGSQPADAIKPTSKTEVRGEKTTTTNYFVGTDRPEQTIEKNNGATTTTDFNPQGDKTKEQIDRDGSHITTKFDPNTHMPTTREEVAPDGKTTTTDFYPNTDHKQRTVEKERGMTTTTDFDAQGAKTKEQTAYDGDLKITTFDPKTGNPIGSVEYTNRDRKTATTTFDRQTGTPTKLVEQFEGDPKTITTTFDHKEKPLTRVTTDGVNTKTEEKFDEKGEAKKITTSVRQPDGKTQSITIENGKIAKIAAPAATVLQDSQKILGVAGDTVNVTIAATPDVAMPAPVRHANYPGYQGMYTVSIGGTDSNRSIPIKFDQQSGSFRLGVDSNPAKHHYSNDTFAVLHLTPALQQVLDEYTKTPQ